MSLEIVYQIGFTLKDELWNLVQVNNKSRFCQKFNEIMRQAKENRYYIRSVVYLVDLITIAYFEKVNGDIFRETMAQEQI